LLWNITPAHARAIAIPEIAGPSDRIDPHDRTASQNPLAAARPYIGRVSSAPSHPQGLASPRLIVAITGANGFVGGEIARLHLDRGDKVRALSRRGGPASEAFAQDLAWHTADLANNAPGTDDALRRFVEGADIVYHAAAELADPDRMHATNVEGSIRLARAALGRIGAFLQVSSVGVYGPGRGRRIDERTPPAPVNPYERSKALADAKLTAIAAETSLDLRILRPSNVIGARMVNGSFRALVDAVRRGRFVEIASEGAMSTYVDVRDVARAAQLVATRPSARGRIYDVSCDCPWTDLLRAIEDAVGARRRSTRAPLLPMRALARIGDLARLAGLCRVPLTTSRLEALISRTSYPSTRLCEELGFAFERPMPDAAAELARRWTREGGVG